MTELRFHHELYDGFAIDEAAKIYDAYGKLELEKQAGGYLVRVTIGDDAVAQGIDERTLCAEIMNYALGKTIESSRSVTMGATTG